ncbi:MAG TPA: protein kinase [Vicinamibacteria bacterium]|nr:protein kinase [Vicinamibacteria bacterium]
MTLASGSRLGPYEILSPLGAGGMGQVYRARDTRLDRNVAVKVLSPRLAESAEALARFEREAKAIAALSHANIVALYDFGRADGVLYAVTELLEGDTLRARLVEGRLSVRKAIDIAAQIAHGLAAAHERGIVHRDLKPENVFLTRDGAVKILDFGLARQSAPSTPSDLVSSPTIARATDPGTVLGTVGYMSPEQVRGQTADHRSDIFSFGSVLYEMLSGRRAFERESAAETMAAIAREDPPELSDSFLSIPEALQRIVHHCLERAPDERFQSARDLAFDLKALATVSSSERGASGIEARASFPFRRVLPGALLLFVGFALGWLSRRSAVPDSGPSGLLRFSQLTDAPRLELSPRLTPDGETLIYASNASGNLDIYTLRVGGHNAANLTADSKDDDWAPALSADGSRIAFRSERDGGGIYLMGATGESVRRLTDFGYDPTWSPDGRYLAIASEGVFNPNHRIGVSELWVVSVDDGERRLLTRRDAVQPAWSPDGARIAFVRQINEERRSTLWTIAAAGPVDVEAAPVIDEDAGNFYPSWSSDGKTLYFSSDRAGPPNLWRVAFDPRTGRALGEPHPVTVPALEVQGMSLSKREARIAFASQTFRSRLSLVSFDARRAVVIGTPRELWSVSRGLMGPRLSPDGQWTAVTRNAGGGVSEDLLLIRTDGSLYRQLTDDRGIDRYASFSPSGDRIAFYAGPQGVRSQIFEVHTDGSGTRQIGSLEEHALYYPLYSPDGSRIAAADEQGGTWLFDLETPSAGWTPLHRLVEGEPLADQVSSWTRDGKWIAGDLIDQSFHRLGIFVESAETGARRRITTKGSAPRWLSDARRLLYLDEGTIRVVDTMTGVDSPVHEEHGPWQLNGFDLSQDETTLLLLERTSESDIWLRTEESTSSR